MGGDIEVWLDCGFAVFVAGPGEDGRARRPDVLLLADDWAAAEELWPKVMVAAAETAVPSSLAEDYRAHNWPGYTVLTRLEAPLSRPDADACADRAKALAGAVYRHLLADAFRETREWCGHTFSVLGR